MPRGLSRAYAVWLVHALGPRRNPLRRLMDRVTAVLTGLLLAMMLLAVPCAALLGNVVHERQKATAAVEAMQRHQVAGVITGPVRLVVVGFDSHSQAFEFHAPVRWTGADGAGRFDDVQVARESEVGAPLPLWVDADERVTPPPRSDQNILGTAIAAAFSTMIGMQLLCAATIAAVWWVAEALAHKSWQREWEIVQPEWTHRG